MSSGVVELQAEVESVLGALLKAATAELTRLFESRYRASGLDVEAGRAANKEGNETSEPPDTVSTGDTKRSIGVQVDEHLYPPELCGPGLLSDGDCLRGLREEEQKRCLIPSEILLTEDNGHVDPEWSLLNQQVVTQTEDLAELMTVDMVELSRFEAELPASGDLQTDVSLHQKEKDHDTSAGSVKETSRHESLKSSPNKQKLLVIQPDTCGLSSGENVKFVCPLILKPESPAPKPDGSEKPVQAEPQSACVSTAKGKAYSPSPSDGAVTPAQVGVWERIHTPKESKNNLHIKLKLMSPDQKLMSVCAVQLVNMLTVPEWEMKLQDKHENSHDATHKNGPPLPKDLRRHQGLHTGHRLCCFTPCGDGVWRLQKVVTHSSSGYTCSICGKTFKRRKILRRHERFHTGEKPYSCSTCSKMFALRKSLRRHLRFHTGERPHTCTQCSKSFRLRDNLKAHLRFHTGEKPFSCPTCGKMFRIMRNLEKHKCEFFVPSFRTIAGW